MPAQSVPPKVADKVMGAAALFAERGLDRVTMNDIAEATGIPRATLYYHFEGKEAVFAFVFSRAFDDFERAVADALQGPGLAAERLGRVLRAQLDFYASHPMAREAVHLNLGRGPQIAEIIERAAAAYFSPVAKLLKEGATDGSIRRVTRPNAVAAALLGAVTTAAGEAFRSGEQHRVDELHDALMALVMHGLAP